MQVVGMGALVPVGGVRQLLATSTHSGFPVYSTTEPRCDCRRGGDWERWACFARCLASRTCGCSAARHHAGSVQRAQHSAV